MKFYNYLKTKKSLLQGLKEKMEEKWPMITYNNNGMLIGNYNSHLFISICCFRTL